MKRRSRVGLIFLLGLALVCRFAFGAELSRPAATIVVYNSEVPESAELAKFYAQKRGIARNHLVGLACSKEEEIARDEYDTTIAKPLRSVFAQRKWWVVHEFADAKQSVAANSIRFIALVKGMPLKISRAPDYPGDPPAAGPVGNRNEASVDSELAVLPLHSRQIQICGGRGRDPHPLVQRRHVAR